MFLSLHKFQTPLVKLERICKETGKVDKLEALFAKKQIKISSVQFDGLSPLQWTCRNGFVDCTLCLLKTGNCDIDHKAPQTGFTALHELCTSTSISTSTAATIVIKALVEIGGANVNTRSEDDSTPLHAACRNSMNEIVEFLCDHGADVNVRDKRGISPLMEACGLGWLNVVVYLIRRCNKESVNWCDSTGCTALHLACVNGQVAVAAYLIDNSEIYVDFRNNAGFLAQDIIRPDANEFRLKSLFTRIPSAVSVVKESNGKISSESSLSTNADLANDEEDEDDESDDDDIYDDVIVDGEVWDSLAEKSQSSKFDVKVESTQNTEKEKEESTLSSPKPPTGLKRASSWIVLPNNSPQGPPVPKPVLKTGFVEQAVTRFDPTPSPRTSLKPIRGETMDASNHSEDGKIVEFILPSPTSTNITPKPVGLKRASSWIVTPNASKSANSPKLDVSVLKTGFVGQVVTQLDPLPCPRLPPKNGNQGSNLNDLFSLLPESDFSQLTTTTASQNFVTDEVVDFSKTIESPKLLTGIKRSSWVSPPKPVEEIVIMVERDSKSKSQAEEQTVEFVQSVLLTPLRAVSWGNDHVEILLSDNLNLCPYEDESLLAIDSSFNNSDGDDELVELESCEDYDSNSTVGLVKQVSPKSNALRRGSSWINKRKSPVQAVVPTPKTAALGLTTGFVGQAVTRFDPLALPRAINKVVSWGTDEPSPVQVSVIPKKTVSASAIPKSKNLRRGSSWIANRKSPVQTSPRTESGTGPVEHTSIPSDAVPSPRTPSRVSWGDGDSTLSPESDSSSLLGCGNNNSREEDDEELSSMNMSQILNESDGGSVPLDEIALNAVNLSSSGENPTSPTHLTRSNSSLARMELIDELCKDVFLREEELCLQTEGLDLDHTDFIESASTIPLVVSNEIACDLAINTKDPPSRLKRGGSWLTTRATPLKMNIPHDGDFLESEAGFIGLNGTKSYALTPRGASNLAWGNDDDHSISDQDEICDDNEVNVGEDAEDLKVLNDRLDVSGSQSMDMVHSININEGGSPEWITNPLPHDGAKLSPRRLEGEPRFSLGAVFKSTQSHNEFNEASPMVRLSMNSWGRGETEPGGSSKLSPDSTPPLQGPCVGLNELGPAVATAKAPRNLVIKSEFEEFEDAENFLLTAESADDLVFTFEKQSVQDSLEAAVKRSLRRSKIESMNVWYVQKEPSLLVRQALCRWKENALRLAIMGIEVDDRGRQRGTRDTALCKMRRLSQHYFKIESMGALKKAWDRFVLNQGQLALLGAIPRAVRPILLANEPALWALFCSYCPDPLSIPSIRSGNAHRKKKLLSKHNMWMLCRDFNISPDICRRHQLDEIICDVLGNVSPRKLSISKDSSPFSYRRLSQPVSRALFGEHSTPTNSPNTKTSLSSPSKSVPHFLQPTTSSIMSRIINSPDRQSSPTRFAPNSGVFFASPSRASPGSDSTSSYSTQNGARSSHHSLIGRVLGHTPSNATMTSPSLSYIDFLKVLWRIVMDSVRKENPSLGPNSCFLALLKLFDSVGGRKEMLKSVRFPQPIPPFVLLEFLSSSRARSLLSFECAES